MDIKLQSKENVGSVQTSTPSTARNLKEEINTREYREFTTRPMGYGAEVTPKNARSKSLD